MPLPVTRIFPSLDHFHYSEFESIYEPAEDTFLLCDALTDRFGISSLIEYPPALVLELGCGSGAAAAHLGNLLAARGLPRPATLCVDINVRACAASLRTAAANCTALHTTDAICADLLGSLLPRLAGRVDVLLFNPPYVPTDDDEVISESTALRSSSEGLLAAAWAGGARGRRVIDRALPQIAACLTHSENCGGRGEAFFVLVDENVPDEVMAEALRWGLDGAIVKRVTAKNERLLVMRLTPTR